VNRRVQHLPGEGVAEVGAHGLGGPVQVLLAAVVVQVHAVPMRHLGDGVPCLPWHPRHEERMIGPRLLELFGAPRSQRLKVGRVNDAELADPAGIAFGLVCDGQS
jgi:hypothetical protein